MSIGSIGAYGGGNQLLLSLLSRLSSTQSTSATTTASGATAASTSATSDSTALAANNLSGPSKAQLSDQVLQLLTMMQASMPTATGTTAGTTSSTSSNATTSSQNGLSSLISAMDTDGDGTVSQSEMEKYIQGLGGTQAQADSLFTALNQGGTGNLTQAQLASDLQNAGPMQGPHGHHHHHHHGEGQQATAGDVASKLMQAMDANGDSAISQSEFENFVTSIGGTTSEADADFSALNTQGSSGITTDQLTSAISAFQSSTATPTQSKNAILTMLDNLGSTSASVTTNGTTSA